MLGIGKTGHMDDLTGLPDWGRLTWPRATERLTLRPATADDADAMFGYRSLEPVARWMTTLPTDARHLARRLRQPQSLRTDDRGSAAS